MTVGTRGLFDIFRVAGDATGGENLGVDAMTTQFRQVAGVVVTPDGTLFACDPVNNQVREVPPSGAPSIACGDVLGAPGFLGDNLPATGSRLDTPTGLERDMRTGVLFVADTGNHRLRYFLPGGRIYSLAGGGSDGGDDVQSALNASLGAVWGLALDANQNVYFTERDTGRVRRVDAQGHLTTLASFGPNTVGPIAVSAVGDRLWVGVEDAIDLVVPGASPGLQPNPVASASGFEVSALAFDQSGTLYVRLSGEGTNGTTGTKLQALTIQASGQAAAGRGLETIAGTGGTSARNQDYSIPTMALPDARSQLLAGAGACSLCIDLYHAGDPTTLSGILYCGNSFQPAGVGAAAQWGQIARMDPIP